MSLSFLFSKKEIREIFYIAHFGFLNQASQELMYFAPLKKMEINNPSLHFYYLGLINLEFWSFWK